ncbi:uncharacterized protein [Montipora foliosa]|uniref:uncharacterized protein isoform X1 n=1 Tax=Montipora foliosa TaxID=591990 RepID=UPI0035F1C038
MRFDCSPGNAIVTDNQKLFRHVSFCGYSVKHCSSLLVDFDNIMGLSIGILFLVILRTFDNTLCFVHSPVNPVWPSGSYALPMANTGCPEGNGFTWFSGHRREELENDHNRNEHSSSNHLKTNVGNPDITRFFCVKNTTETDVSRPEWPEGKYCIYKKGYFCPLGFHKGYVVWDDNNGENGSNRNSIDGELPEGHYDRNTMIYYCCKSTGAAEKRIPLPVIKPFYLLAFDSPTCQEVKGAVYSLEYIVFDTENSNNSDAKVYPYPYGAHLKDPTIYYCYYRECKSHFTGPVGTFSSPYFPQNYHDFHDCQWNITVLSDHVIWLQFDAFELESSPYSCGHAKCSCDYVEIKEVSLSGDVTFLGRYCMANVPLGPILSSTNMMMVTFHSDHAISAKGFNASYIALLANAGVSNKSTSERNRALSAKSSPPTRGTVQEYFINKISTPKPHRLSSKKPGNTMVEPASRSPLNHLNESSWLSKPATGQIMGLPPKYFFTVIGSFVVVITGIVFLAFKLMKRNCSPTKSYQNGQPFGLVTYNSQRNFNRSSFSSSSLTSDRKEEIYIPEKHQQMEQTESNQGCCIASEKRADRLQLSDNPLYDSHKHSNGEESRTENPLYEDNICPK